MQSKSLTPSLYVGPQIDEKDLALAARKFRSIINNRPDGEEPGQPVSAQLEAAAKRLGLSYRHIPIVPGQLSDDNIDAFADALGDLEGPVFAFCRTGARSTSMWALIEASHGDIDQILTRASDAGYDLGALRPRLEQIAQSGLTRR